jgi:hypothetical protein
MASLGLALAKIALRAYAAADSDVDWASDIADAIDDGTGGFSAVRGWWRRRSTGPAEQQLGRAITAELEKSIPGRLRSIYGNRPLSETEDHEIAAAATTAITVIAGLIRTDRRYTADQAFVTALTKPDELRDWIFNHGGSARRGDVAAGRPEQVYDLVITAACDHLTAVAPRAGHTVPAALTRLLDQAEQLQTKADRIAGGVEEVRSQTDRIGAGVDELLRLHQGTNGAVDAYRAEVAAAAPPQLLDREKEVAAFRSFLQATDLTSRGGWWGWRGAEKTGKTGLLATLATDSKLLPGVDVVPFLILRNQSGRNDCAAFLARTLPVLGGLAGVPTPLDRDPLTGADTFRRLLTRAAAVASARSRRLLVVIDGLDEDPALLDPDHTPSIAGLLPAQLPPGTIVLVSARPNPPPAHDVPKYHPLRNPDTWHLLERSVHAAGAADPSDLDELMRTPEGAHIVGYLAAASAPLTAANLTELLGHHPDQPVRMTRTAVQDLLDRRQARTLITVPIPRSEKPGYRLGHETLDTRAIINLYPNLADHPVDAATAEWAAQRQAILASYRDGIHAWATVYIRSPDRWPSDTPTYLIDSYPPIIAVDPHRNSTLIDVLCDPARHDRLFAIYGSQYPAAEQTHSAAEHLVHRRPIDFYALGRLLITQHRLQRTDRDLPPELPAVYVKCGQPQLAIDLTNSINEGSDGIRARLDTAVAFAVDGDTATARTLLDQARRVARTLNIREREEIGRAFIRTAAALAAAGDTTTAYALVDDGRRMAPWINAKTASALMRTAAAFAAARDITIAQKLIEEIRHAADNLVGLDRVCVLSEIVAAYTVAGDTTAARIVFDDTRRIASSLEYWDPDTALAEVAKALIRLAAVHAEAGDSTAAHSLLDDARRVAPTANAQNRARIGDAFIEAAAAFAASGDTTTAHNLTDEARHTAGVVVGSDRVRVLIKLATAYTAVGEITVARTLLDDALLTDAVSYGNGASRLIEIAAAYTATGDTATGRHLLNTALRIVSTLPTKLDRLDTSTAIASALAAAAATLTANGDRPGARMLLVDACHAVTSITNRWSRAHPRSGIATALARAAAVQAAAGDTTVALTLLEDARRTADILTDDWAGAQACAVIAVALARVAAAQTATGDITVARSLFNEADQTAKSVSDGQLSAKALTEIAAAHTAAGDTGQGCALFSEACEVADSIADGPERSLALTELVVALARTAIMQAAAGDTATAGKLLNNANSAAKSIADDSRRGFASAVIATGLAKTAGIQAAEGESSAARALFDDALNIASALSDHWQRTKAFTGIAAGYVVAGDATTASALLQEARHDATTITGALSVTALTEIAVAYIPAGDVTAARTLLEDALHIVATLPIAERARGLTEIAAAYIAAGDTTISRTILSDARKAVNTLTDRRLRAKAFTGIAAAYITAGDADLGHAVLNDALQAANTLEGSTYAQVLNEIADSPDDLRSEEDTSQLIAYAWFAHGLPAPGWDRLTLADLTSVRALLPHLVRAIELDSQAG